MISYQTSLSTDRHTLNAVCNDRPATLASRLTRVSSAGTDEATVKLPAVAPVGTVMAGGTDATESLVASSTTVFSDAGWPSVTVAIMLAPPNNNCVSTSSLLTKFGAVAGATGELTQAGKPCWVQADTPIVRQMPSVRASICICIGILASGCTASFPTEPSFTPQPVSLVVHYPTGGTKATLGTTFDDQQFEAYTIDSDGVWARVTTQATWSSSDTQGLIPATTTRGFFGYRNPGNYVIYATYQGLQGTLPLEIRPPKEFPYLELQVQSLQFHGVFLFTSGASSGRQQLQTSQVTFSTSDPSVGFVDERGAFRAVSPGNVRITAVRDGLSDFYWRSVAPR
jgi:Bacterial Ig-like domain (group 2)